MTDLVNFISIPEWGLIYCKEIFTWKFKNNVFLKENRKRKRFFTEHRRTGEFLIQFFHGQINSSLVDHNWTPVLSRKSDLLIL